MLPPTPMPTPCRCDACESETLRPILILLPCLPSTHAGEAHARPTCRHRQLLESWDPLVAAAHRYLLLSFPLKPDTYNMFVIWSENLRFIETMLVPCGLVVFHVCVNWTEVGDWLIVNWICICASWLWCCFFGFLALWLYHSVFVFVTLYLVLYR